MLIEWVFTGEGMGVRVDDLTEVLPEGLAEHLLDGAFSVPSDDPERELLVFEAQLRNAAQSSDRRLQRAEVALQRQRDFVDELDAELAAEPDAARRGVVAHARANAVDLLGSIEVEFAAAADCQEHWRMHIAELHDFINRLDVAHDPLAAAAKGWRRGGTKPAHVHTFDSEEDFVRADRRRAAGTRWITVLNAEQLGRGWRRDHDDDNDPVAGDPTLVGPWEIGYLHRTGELYALRRPWGELGAQVWLLGEGYSLEQARVLLARADRYRLTPNSLLLLADMIHAEPGARSGNDQQVDPPQRPAV